MALGLPVGEMLRRTTSQELTEWMAFYELEPFGEERDDYRAGVVASTVAEVNRNPKKRRKPFTPQEFLPEFGRGAGVEEEQPSPAALKRKWLDVVAAFAKK